MTFDKPSLSNNQQPGASIETNPQAASLFAAANNEENNQSLDSSDSGGLDSDASRKLAATETAANRLLTVQSLIKRMSSDERSAVLSQMGFEESTEQSSSDGHVFSGTAQTNGPVFVSTSDSYQMKLVNNKAVLELREYLRVRRSKGYPCDKRQIISDEARHVISVKLVQKEHYSVENKDNWLSLPAEEDDAFCKALLKYFPPIDGVATGSLEDQVKALKLDYRPEDITSVQPFLIELNKVWERLPIHKQTGETVVSIAKLLQPIIKASGPLFFGVRLAEKMAHGGHPTNIIEYAVRLTNEIELLKSAFYEMLKCMGTDLMQMIRNHKAHKQLNKSVVTSGSSGSTGKPAQGAKVEEFCGGCGRGVSAHHNKGNCPFKSHPDFNTANVPFNQSEAYRLLQANGSRSMLNGKFRASGTPLDTPIVTHSVANTKGALGKRPHRFDGSQNKRYKGEQSMSFNAVDHIALPIESDDFDDTELYTIPCNIVNCTPSITVNILLDTGALQANYVNQHVAEAIRHSQSKWCESECECSKGVDVGGGSSMMKVQSENDISHKCNCECVVDVSGGVQKSGGIYARNDVVVCSAFSGNCNVVQGAITFTLSVFNELINNFENIKISAFIIDTPYDIIIGRPDVMSYGLLFKCASHFSDDYEKRVKNHFVVKNAVKFSLSLASLNAEYNLDARGNHSISSGNRVDKRANRYGIASCNNRGFDSKHTQLAIAQLTLLNSLVSEQNHTNVLDYVEDDDEIVYEDDSMLYTKYDVNSNDCLPYIDGSDPAFYKKMKELCMEFKDIFSRGLRPEPALLPPMEIHFKNDGDGLDRWKIPRNRGPARLQSSLKQQDIYKQVQALKDNNCIAECEAAEYSQVLLVPKPDATWRFCIDYRYLNEISESRGWPIPNIPLMLQRIGAKRARYYGKMDLTKGYYQAPLSPAAQIFTAFITFLGVFQWLRVPMGVKGAPSYFQRVMATIVLAGLIYIICELYMDDILVYAATQEEFINNIRQVFIRFRKYKITVQPDKCMFGVPEVEFVGHELNHEAISFSKEKRSKVLNFPKPTTVKGMRSFLGLANYFRDHIKNHSTKVRPLQDMLSVERNKPLKWTELAESRFEEIKLEISNCPSLFFLDPNAPIHLETDASDYGIGGYLYQLKDGIDRPVVFISKTLSSVQLNWSVPEKEAYAIFYCFMKLDYLLRDVAFHLHTDHKNLTYINTAGSSKVLRWKLAIQEFTFDIHYLKGENNIVADAFSRLCVIEHDKLDKEVTLQELNDVYIVPDDKLNLIKEVHNEVEGHHGVERTLAKLRLKHSEWLYMREHVKYFIKHCPFCQKMQYSKVVTKTAPFTTARTEPMECLNIDSIGPMPDGAYILVIICCFTRFVELYYVPDTTALEAAKVLLQHMGRYGAPSQLRSDRGTQFANDLIEEFLRLVGTEHLLTLAYSKEENAIVERANKEVMRHLRAIIFNKNIIEDWHLSLPLVQRIMNASVHSSIGVSPAQLLFGNAITLDRGILLPFKSNSSEQMSLSEWASNMLLKQEELLRIAKENQLEKDVYHIASQSGDDVTHFPENSYVLVDYHNRPPTKLHTVLKGPVRVVSNDKANYSLQDLVTNRMQNVHVSKLRPYRFDARFAEPREVANKDRQVFDVERIIEHTGHKGRKTSMRFHVKWVGYDDKTWEPWDNLKTNQVLHDYLRQHNMEKLIPKSYRA